MIRRLALIVLAGICSLHSFAIVPPAPRVVDLTAPDGTKLKATYFASGKPGPGVMLFHQCNRDRKMWNDLAPRLAELGLNILTLDFRGYGDSGGTAQFKLSPQEAQRMVVETWPHDVDTAFAYLLAQPGVAQDVMGAGGASCGVNQSIQLARRHANVKSLVLLSGSTDHEGRHFLHDSPQLPIFASAADDDGGAVEVVQWILSVSRNPGNQFQHYQKGGHGIEMFAPHSELSSLIVNWFDTTLLKTPGRPPENRAGTNAPPAGMSILETIDEPGGAAKAAELLAQARKSDPKVTLFPEGIANLIGYEHLQAGDNKGAIEIFKLNIAAYPDSPNTYDSLADAYAADGQSDLAIQTSEKVLKMIESDTRDSEDRRKIVRDSAEQRLKQLRSDVK